MVSQLSKMQLEQIFQGQLTKWENLLNYLHLKYKYNGCLWAIYYESGKKECEGYIGYFL